MVGKGNRLRRRLAALVYLAASFVVVLQPLCAEGAEKLVLELSSGRRIEARVDFPRGPGPFPVILIFGGFQKAGEVIALMRASHLGDGQALASFDYPFDPPRKLLFPQSLFWIPQLRQMVRDTLEGITQLSAALERDPRLEGSRRLALGASLGAPMVLGAAAQGASFTHLAMVHGFGDFRGTIAWQFERPWRERWGRLGFAAPWVARALSELLLWNSGIGEAEDWVRELPAGLPVLSIRASRDRFVPASAVESLEEALKISQATVSFAQTQGDHLQPGALETLREIRVQVEAWEAQTKRSANGIPSPLPRAQEKSPTSEPAASPPRRQARS
jgi:dienelactone hydrolase